MIEKVTGHTHSFFFKGRQVEFDRAASPEARLKELCNPRYLSDYERAIYEALFPKEVDVAEFEIHTVVPEPLSAFDVRATRFDRKEKIRVGEPEQQGQKLARDIFLRALGFLSPQDKLEFTNTENVEAQVASDVPILHVAFTNASSAITTGLHQLPMIKRMADQGQTTPKFIDSEGADFTLVKTTRLMHSKDYARGAAQTIARLAIKQPDRFIAAMQREYGYYQLFASGNLPEGKNIPTNFPISRSTKETVTKILAEDGVILKGDKDIVRQALEIGFEVSKYALVYAYLHDSQTLGWGDIVQKARAHGDGRTPVDYSEDEELGNKIEDFIYSDKASGLAELCTSYELNPEVLVTMVKSLCSEGDPYLLGQILKNKGKYIPELHKLDFPHRRPNMPGDDLDQISGTRTNLQQLAVKYLPGGFVHYTGLKEEEQKMPLGSYDIRLGLLAYMMLSGMSKKDLEYCCLKENLDIDTSQLFIYAEEMSIGPNVGIEHVQFPYTNPSDQTQTLVNEAELVCYKPGDVKRNMLTFNMLQAIFYRSSSRSTMEAFVQDMITAGLFGENDNKQTPGPISMDIFKLRTDYEVYEKLRETALLIPYTLYELEQRSTILSEDELKKQIVNGELPPWLILETNISHITDLKPGTLSMKDPPDNGTDDLIGEVDFYINFLTHHRDRTENPTSIVKRITNAENAVSGKKWYRVIKTTQEQFETMMSLLEENPETLISMTRAMLFWTKEINLGDTAYSSPLREHIELLRNQYA